MSKKSNIYTENSYNEENLKFMLNPYDIISLIAKYRKERGLSIEELSKLVNVSHSTLRRIESRETEKIDYALVIKLKSILNISDEEILWSMNHMEEEEEKQNMELANVHSDIASCNICRRVTYGDNNIKLDPSNLRELRIGYKNQCQIITMCKSCREKLRNMLNEDLSKN